MINNKELFNENYLFERNNCDSNIKNTISKNYDWLNLDKLIETIRKSGTNIVIIFGSDILKNLNSLKLIYNNTYKEFNSIHNYKLFIETKIKLKFDVTEINFL